MDTTELALKECNVWFIANQDDPWETVAELSPDNQIEIHIFIFPVDGLWT